MSAPGRRRGSDDTLYELLPAIYRTRDEGEGHPLRSLLRAIASEADRLAADIGQLYDNWFIETCEDDLVEFFAELVGLSLGPAVPSQESAPSVVADAAWRRRQVANAIADRRRKGSVAVLAQLAADATGWPARAVELDGLLMTTQSVQLPDVGRRPLADLADQDALQALGTPLSQAAPLADVRRLSSHRTPGTADPAGVVVWLWRLAAEEVRRAPAADAGDDGTYAFDQLGRDMPLAVRPTARTTASSPATGLDVPTEITRLTMERRLEDYYGPGRSICVYRDGHPVPRSEILVADLAHWRAHTPPGHVSIDPELGRLAFPERHAPEDGVQVSYAHLGLAAIGGGAYERPAPADGRAARIYRVGRDGAGLHRTVGAALHAWREALRKDPAQVSAVIEIGDDGVYEEPFEIQLAADERLVLRAAPGRRPILIPVQARNRPAEFRVIGPEAGRPGYGSEEHEPEPGRGPVFVLDGIWIAGHPLELMGRFGAVRLRHCTLVPESAWVDIDPRRELRAPSLVIRGIPCPVSIASSVVGRIRVESAEAGFDPIALTVADSVIDASEPDGHAVRGADGRRAWVSLSLRRVTVLGAADVAGAELVEDSILTGPLRCERRQTGAVRFSYLPPGSHTPRRTACQPDDALAEVHQRREQALTAARVAPRFDAVRFGAPAYARLAADVAPEIARGAHDEGELGAYHDLWEALRVADLRSRLREFTPAGTDIDIRFAT
jgi:hypothetical protein